MIPSDHYFQIYKQKKTKYYRENFFKKTLGVLNYQMLKKSDSSNIEREFVKTYHQQWINLGNCDQKVDFFSQ